MPSQPRRRRPRANVVCPPAAEAALRVVVLCNALVRPKVLADNAWADIDVQLKRRHDLIPDSVETALTLRGHPLRVIGIRKAVVGERLLVATVPFSRAETLIVPAPATRARGLGLNAARVEDVMAIKAMAEADRRNPDWRAKGQVMIAWTGLDRLLAMNQGILVFKILMGAAILVGLAFGTYPALKAG